MWGSFTVKISDCLLTCTFSGGCCNGLMSCQFRNLGVGIIHRQEKVGAGKEGIEETSDRKRRSKGKKAQSWSGPKSRISKGNKWYLM